MRTKIVAIAIIGSAAGGVVYQVTRPAEKQADCRLDAEVIDSPTFQQGLIDLGEDPSRSGFYLINGDATDWMRVHVEAWGFGADGKAAGKYLASADHVDGHKPAFIPWKDLKRESDGRPWVRLTMKLADVKVTAERGGQTCTANVTVQR